MREARRGEVRADHEPERIFQSVASRTYRPGSHAEQAVLPLALVARPAPHSAHWGCATSLLY